MSDSNKLMEIYDALCGRYGNLNWWPASSQYEVIVGAVLTQNTAWGNVEKAIANFKGKLEPQLVETIGEAELAETIRPSGFFNQKAGYLKAVTAWYRAYGYDVKTVQREHLDKLRAELLGVRGVGRETADSILLYAFGFPTFVVDAYTMRLCERYPLKAGSGYEQVKSYFESNLPKSAELYNNYHALIVINGKDCCRKKPLCNGSGQLPACPLQKLCEKGTEYEKNPDC